jgi:hypothetical protein
LAGKLLRSRHQLFWRNNFIHQPELQSFFGAKDAAGEQQVAGAFLADVGNQKT